MVKLVHPLWMSAGQLAEVSVNVRLNGEHV
jgi:hypothetical protein